MPTLELMTPFMRMAEPDTQEEGVEKAAGVRIHGFASTKGIDRHGQNIDPKRLNIEALRKNGQLWLNHSLYRRPDTGTEVAVGRITAAQIAYVQEKARGGYTILEYDTDKRIKSISRDEGERMGLSDSTFGLWVEAEVLEPEIVELVKDGRLNAFSWHGVGLQNANGTFVEYDVREVSLVNVPANVQALFTISKDALTTVGTYYVLNDDRLLPFSDMEKASVIDGDAPIFVVLHMMQDAAVVHTMKGGTLAEVELASQMLQTKGLLASGVYMYTGRKTQDGDPVYTCVSRKGVTDKLDAEESVALGLSPTKHTTKGGEDTMPEDKKDATSVEDLLKGLNETLTTNFASFNERLAALEAKKAEAEEPAPAKKEPPKEEPEKAADKKGEDDEDEDEKDKGKREKKSAGDDAIQTQLSSIAKAMTDGFASLSDRVKALEGAPAPSKDVSDESRAVAVQKGLGELKKEDREALLSRGLTDIIVPRRTTTAENDV